MRKITITVLAILSCALFLPEGASAIEGFRGSTWGELRYDIPRDLPDNLLMTGWIKQGIDWKKWGESTTLNTYATLRYKWDTEKYDWNNSLEPGIGISIDTFSPKGLGLTAGVEYIWENRFLLDDNKWYDQKTVVYVSWYGWWDLKK